MLATDKAYTALSAPHDIDDVGQRQKGQGCHGVLNGCGQSDFQKLFQFVFIQREFIFSQPPTLCLFFIKQIPLIKAAMNCEMTVAQSQTRRSHFQKRHRCHIQSDIYYRRHAHKNQRSYRIPSPRKTALIPLYKKIKISPAMVYTK